MHCSTWTPVTTLDRKDSDRVKLKIGVYRLLQDDVALAKSDVRELKSTIAGGNDMSVKDRVAISVNVMSGQMIKWTQ